MATRQPYVRVFRSKPPKRKVPRPQRWYCTYHGANGSKMFTSEAYARRGTAVAAGEVYGCEVRVHERNGTVTVIQPTSESALRILQRVAFAVDSQTWRDILRTALAFRTDDDERTTIFGDDDRARLQADEEASFDAVEELEPIPPGGIVLGDPADLDE